MKLRIYEAEEPEEKVVRVKLFRDGNGIQVGAVDKDGDRLCSGSLWFLNDDGTQTLAEGVNPGLGLQLVGDGQIKQK